MFLSDNPVFVFCFVLFCQTPLFLMTANHVLKVLEKFFRICGIAAACMVHNPKGAG